MASIGHIAVGMAAARIYRDEPSPRYSSMAAWSALSLLPDIDVIGFALGVEYGDPWGHRGATHSLTFAMAIAAALGLAAPRARRPRVRTWLMASAVLVSHGLLDTLTDGGLGCALLWPFDLTRYFAPWRPIPVAPIGLYFLSPYGFFVALTELILFAPIFLFALRPARIKSFLLPLWGVAVWLIASGDPIRDAVLGFVLREDTEFASGFSDRSFRTIKTGESDTDVRHMLGAPFDEWWSYARSDPSEVAANQHECQVVHFESEAVAAEPGVEACTERGVRVGMSRTDVRRTLGVPAFECWGYSRSPGNRLFRARVVCFSDGRVSSVFRRWVSR